MRILLVFGTRPEAIKMACLAKLFAVDSFFETKVCVTAQHREMLDQVLDLFQIKPDYDLNIMEPGQNLTSITSTILLKMNNVFKDFNPDLVLVHGDTTTAFATSLAAFYAKIPIAHIEAGLRTGNIHSPWPEEANRKLISGIAQLHFCPTTKAQQNLLDENISPENTFVTGNTVIDSLLTICNKIESEKELSLNLEEKFNFLKPGARLILITGHRRENFGQGFLNICEALKELSLEFPDVDFVFPVHLNPNVKEPVNSLLSGIANIHLITPLGYVDFVYLMMKSTIILTDSGGIQEEAPSLNKPVLVMRDTTERPEAVESGVVKLVGTSKSDIVFSVKELLNDSAAYYKMAKIPNPYGDGASSKRIIEIIKSTRLA